LVYRVHALLGIGSALLVAVVCLSGAAAVYKPEVEWATSRVLRGGGEPIPTARVALDAALASVEREHPGVRITAMALPGGPASQVTNGRVIGLQGKLEGAPTEFFCEAETGALLGSRPHGAGWGQWLRDFHVRLFAGKWGRIFVGVIGVAMLVSTVTGLIIYYRFNGKRWLPRWRGGRGARISSADLHRATGLGSALASLLFAVSGVVLAWPVVDPTHRPLLTIEGEAPARELWGDGILTASALEAERALPGTRAAFVTLPRNGDASIRVFVDHQPGELVRQLASHALFEPVSGELVHRHDARETGVAARAFLALEPLHFGRFGDSASLRLVWAVAGVVLGAVAGSGGVIWGLRLRQKRRSRLSRVGGGVGLSMTSR
jgi:uncharacterized iron-regulated membrane protein